MTRTFYLFLVFIAFQVLVIAQPKFEYYDEDQKQIKSEEHFLKGNPHGKTITYFKNGKVSKLGWNKYGKQDSVWKYYYENGTLKAEEHFSRGMKTGRNTYFYKTGKPAQQTVFDQDRPDSTWTAWYENGQIKSQEVFVKENAMGFGNIILIMAS